MTTDQLPKPTHWYRVDRAARIASELTEGEDYCLNDCRWTYQVIPDDEEPNEYAAVAMFDQDGQFVAYWNEY